MFNSHQPVLSIALESTNEPSGLRRSPVTVSVCPDILYNTSFFLRSHTCTKQGKLLRQATGDYLLYFKRINLMWAF